MIVVTCMISLQASLEAAWRHGGGAGNAGVHFLCQCFRPWRLHKGKIAYTYLNCGLLYIVNYNTQICVIVESNKMVSKNKHWINQSYKQIQARFKSKIRGVSKNPLKVNDER